jgi:hypothetical protein
MQPSTSSSIVFSDLTLGPDLDRWAKAAATSALAPHTSSRRQPAAHVPGRDPKSSADRLRLCHATAPRPHGRHTRQQDGIHVQPWYDDEPRRVRTGSVFERINKVGLPQANVSREFSFDDAPEALAFMQTGGSVGKLCLVITEAEAESGVASP